MNKASFGEILQRTGSYLSGDIMLALGLLVVFAGLGTLADIYQANVNAGFNIGTTVAEFYVLRHLCQRYNLVRAPGPGGFWPYFGMCILTGLAILVGCVLLIVPGLFLAARWSAATGLVIAQGRGVTDAMRESWRMTAQSTWSIVGAIVVMAVPGVAALGVSVMFGDELGNVPPTVSLVMNIGLFASMILSWYLGLAVYSLLVDRDDGLGEVFA